MESYAERYATTIHDVSSGMGPVPRMAGASLATVHKQLCDRIPLEKLQERRQWRDAALTKLAVLKKEVEAMPKTGLRK